MERILCAAIWFKERPTPVHSVANVAGQVWTGYRHPDIISLFYENTGLKLSEAGPYDQGFLTSEKRYVDREEGAKIAFAAGQIKEQKNKLFSEDLY
jgi:hypothetical protein